MQIVEQRDVIKRHAVRRVERMRIFYGEFQFYSSSSSTTSTSCKLSTLVSLEPLDDLLLFFLRNDGSVTCESNFPVTDFFISALSTRLNAFSLLSLQTSWLSGCQTSSPRVEATILTSLYVRFYRRNTIVTLFIFFHRRHINTAPLLCNKESTKMEWE